MRTVRHCGECNRVRISDKVTQHKLRGRVRVYSAQGRSLGFLTLLPASRAQRPPVRPHSAARAASHTSSHRKRITHSLSHTRTHRALAAPRHRKIVHTNQTGPRPPQQSVARPPPPSSTTRLSSASARARSPPSGCPQPHLAPPWSHFRLSSPPRPCRRRSTGPPPPSASPRVRRCAARRRPPARPRRPAGA